MSRIKSEKVNFSSPVLIKLPEKAEVKSSELDLQTQIVIDKASREAQEQAQKILEQAQTQAQAILDEAQEKLSQAQAQVEQIHNEAYEKAQKEGFETGYAEGKEQIMNELQERVQAVDVFSSANFEIKHKILKSAEKDVVALCIAICRKVCHKLLDADVVAKIVEQSFLLLDSKEKVNVILNPALADILGDSLIEKFQNVSVSQNPKIAQDAIIVEALSDRVDASINTQIDEISNAFLSELGKSRVE